ncbi:MAG TPA: hypothetical protein DCZ61_08370, partial [Lachnospiraceae bacterium]|nr:hypothetical protein [Lachnospiraceae bacterium]
MKEKVLSGRKNGLLILFVTTILMLASIGGIIFGGILVGDQGRMIGLLPLICGIVFLCVGWILYCGLKVLKPQEALVLTLFGKYIG